MSPSPPAAQPPPNSALEQPDPPESTASSRHWLGLDRLGVLQILGGIAISLIALFSSYDHITLLGTTIALQQQWGIPFIVASLATVVVDAQLASGSRLRAAQDAARVADETARERYRANRERKRAAEASERQVQAAASQRESLEDIRRGVFLSARVQLDPCDGNRGRLQAFLALMGQRPMGEQEGS